MFDHLFENRNTTVTNLIKLGDCLGRSLRENVELFSIDSEEGKVAFLTESGKVISGNYSLEGQISLEGIQVQASEIFEQNEEFDTLVDTRVSEFVGSLNSDHISEASESFSDILGLWESRLKFENVKKRLNQKVDIFSESQDILNTQEFERFYELMPQFMEFLEENRDEILSVQELANSSKLSASVSRAFNFPKLSLEELVENKDYVVKDGLDKNIYEMICKQELIQKELLESKMAFDNVWATNGKVRKLASLVFEDSEEEILEALVEAVIEIPYLALSTKRQLNECISDACDILDYSSKSDKQISEFVSNLYEMKKPLKATLISVLNEKYGINVSNLKDTPSFSSLAKTQVVLFECLARLTKKGSVLKECLQDVAKMLKNKNGVEVIDVNDIIAECFAACELDILVEEPSISESADLATIFLTEGTAKELLEKAKEKMLMGKKEKKGEEDTESGDEEDDSARKAKKELSPAQKKLDVDGDGDIEGSDLAALRAKKGKKKDEEVEEATAAPEAPEQEPEAQAPEQEDAPEPMDKEEFFKALTDLEGVLDSLDTQDEAEPEEEEEKE
jgi:hypothetical protein